MNVFKYLRRQLKRLKIDLLTQRTFLAGDVPSIDNSRIIKTASTNYEELEVIFFERLQIKLTDIIIDVGCGKARVFNYLLYKGLKNKMIGYEINKAVGIKTKQRLARYNNVQIRTENIFNTFPNEGDIFYLYNPFKEEMMRLFIAEILKLKGKQPIIVYNNPIHLALFKPCYFTFDLFDIPIVKYGYNFSFAIIRVNNPL